MRLALALATAAGSLVALVPASSATANVCGATFPGLTISHLQLHHGVSCDHAKQVVHHGLRGQAYRINWSCRHETVLHREYHFNCWADNGSGHWLTFIATYG